MSVVSLPQLDERWLSSLPVENAGSVPRYHEIHWPFKSRLTQQHAETRLELDSIQDTRHRPGDPHHKRDDEVSKEDRPGATDAYAQRLSAKKAFLDFHEGGVRLTQSGPEVVVLGS